jgi:hypothetical protein
LRRDGQAGMADGPAVGRRRARNAKEDVVLHGPGVGRADDGPRGPVPVLDQSLIGVAGGAAGVVIADGPAVGRGRARHASKEICPCGIGVGRGSDAPRRPVPVHDDGLKDGGGRLVVPDGPAVRRRRARHAVQVVLPRCGGVGRIDYGP